MDAKLLGSRIRQAREDKGLSQQELADLISRDQAAISAYEIGKRKISAVDLPLLAQALDVSVMYFFEGQTNVHDLDRLLLEEFQELPSDESKHTVIGIVRLLRELFSKS